METEGVVDWTLRGDRGQGSVRPGCGYRMRTEAVLEWRLDRGLLESTLSGCQAYKMLRLPQKNDTLQGL